jgi:hypothetical protein
VIVRVMCEKRPDPTPTLTLKISTSYLVPIVSRQQFQTPMLKEEDWIVLGMQVRAFIEAWYI